MNASKPDHEPQEALARVVGVPGAVLMGLGSILGTGIFVSIGIAAGVAGSAVLLAVALAAVVALFNGLSSAQLAANHPVSGGTYEYGYRYLNPALGFSAGWMFVCAKSASAATAALGFAGYALTQFGVTNDWARVALAVVAVAVLTGIVAGGMRRSNRANAIIVLVTLASLVVFVIAGLPSAVSGFRPQRLAEQAYDAPSLLHATALMFVAYTGYGRIATLGEEVRDPARSIPRAIVVTLIVSMGLYVAVTFVAVGSMGAGGLANATRAAAAPLEVAAHGFGLRGVSVLIGIGAVTAMLGVLLNLLLGLSRVLLAMARRGDMPSALARVDSQHSSPRRAVIVTGAIIAAITLVGSVQLAWSFSAFTVLVYYALTNLAALQLPADQRRYPRWVAAAGLLSCLGLAFWVEPMIWATGLGLIAAGLVWHAIARRRASHSRE
ncbi:Amino acid transporter, permease [Enhygromyxa salina]|uniref:Amino acid transporter, permease n=1 Tax=Enhygromyxa salina TaxID=215803 RepID=A0A0C2DEJ0_9BACT|nr:APC family permease [Enhygromyxa salina]KIG18097.1 Amino acid transporter, permease [Enhygromyxa salina]